MITAQEAAQMLQTEKTKYNALIATLKDEAIPNAFDAEIKQAVDHLKNYFSAGQVYSRLLELYPQFNRQFNVRDVIPYIKEVAEVHGFKYEHNEDDKRCFPSDDIVF
jgi:hypothetical protein